MTVDIHRYFWDLNAQRTDFYVFLHMMPIGMTFCCDIRINTYIGTCNMKPFLILCQHVVDVIACLYLYRLSNHICLLYLRNGSMVARAHLFHVCGLVHMVG